ncbi:helix-turn-helix domain-containing protein [Clostridium gasigenes]
MYNSKNYSILEITKATGISKATIYQYINNNK